MFYISCTVTAMLLVAERLLNDGGGPFHDIFLWTTSASPFSLLLAENQAYREYKAPTTRRSLFNVASNCCTPKAAD